MKRKVTPGVLATACNESGMTIAKLSENTGIPEQELVQFDAGELALSANDWMGILCNLAQSQPDLPPHAVMPGIAEAYRQLAKDADFEDLFRDVTGEEPD